MQQRPGNSVDDARLIRLDPHHSDRKGDLCVVSGMADIGFDISRVFYLYDVPAGADRGQHAHIRDHELIVAVSGCFTVRLIDGEKSREFVLKRPYEMLHIPPGLWVQLYDFSSGSVALVMCRYPYNPCDYIKSYDEYLRMRRITPNDDSKL